MTTTEQAMQDLRNAIRAEMIDELKTWWATAADNYQYEAGATDAIEDAIITLEG